MPGNIAAPEQESNLVPIRMTYFPKPFWEFWDQLEDRPKAAYILGWLLELETAVRKMSEQVRKINDHLEDD